MLMLITLLNDGTLISIGYDNVVPNPRPDRWNLRVRPPPFNRDLSLSTVLNLWLPCNPS